MRSDELVWSIHRAAFRGNQNMDRAHQLRSMELQPWFGDRERQSYLEAGLYAGEIKSENENLRGQKLVWNI